MEPVDVEFLAEKEAVQVVPKFTLDRLFLITGDIGPFTAGLPVDVPLWVAIHLKQRQKCTIVPPTWMNVETLEQVKQNEKESQFFTQMPSQHYMEVSQLLLEHAVEDIPRADEVRTLIKDIWDIRTSKLRTSIDSFVKTDATHAKLNYLTLMELNAMRPLLTETLNQLHRLRALTLKDTSVSQYTQ